MIWYFPLELIFEILQTPDSIKYAPFKLKPSSKIMALLGYVAISGSFYYANPVPASLFMIGFGLGTIPLLYLVQQFPKKSVLFKRWKTQYLLAFIGFLVGLLILLRGLGLGIPYLSPPTQKMNLIEAVNHECSP